MWKTLATIRGAVAGQQQRPRTEWRGFKKERELSSSTSGSTPQTTESRNLDRYLYPHVHSSIIHSNQKVKAIQCPLKDEWINKIWKIHSMEYYSALKMRKILIHAIAWMNLEDIMLSEMRTILYNDKSRYCVVPFTRET